MQSLLIAPDGVRAAGELAQLVQDRGIVTKDIKFVVVDPTPTGEVLGLAFEFSDGSVVGAMLSPAEAQGLIRRIQLLLTPPAPPAPELPAKPRLTLVLDTSKIHKGDPQ